MGTPIPIPFVPSQQPAGNPCSNGWGPGKPFGDGPTPEKIWLEFNGVEKGPNWQVGDGEPVNGLFELTQDVGAPCAYALLAFPGTKFCTFTTTDIEVAGTNASPFLFFRNEDVPYDNLIGDNTVDDHFTGGEVKIIIPKV